MFKEEYKNAYEEIKADNGSVNKILERAKRKSTYKKKGMGWKPAIVTMLLAVTLFVGVNIPTFAQEINQMVTISQMTPGPLACNIATYIGVKLYGIMRSTDCYYCICNTGNYFHDNCV